MSDKALNREDAVCIGQIRDQILEGLSLPGGTPQIRKRSVMGRRLVVEATFALG
jgi:hypothetical protein